MKISSYTMQIVSVLGLGLVLGLRQLVGVVRW